MQGLVYLDFLEPDEYAPSIRTLQSRIPLERGTRESRRCGVLAFLVSGNR